MFTVGYTSGLKQLYSCMNNASSDQCPNEKKKKKNPQQLKVDIQWEYFKTSFQLNPKCLIRRISVQFMQRSQPVFSHPGLPHPERVSRAESAHLMPLAVLTEKYLIKTFWQRAKEIVAQRNKLLQA